jgi:heptosyltransferase-1
MKVLIIKMSSLGDVLHTLPALTDAGKAIPGIQFDWVVEESFAQLPAWHPLVNKVIPLAFRRLRKTPLKSLLSKEWKNFKKNLQTEKYDLVIDAQGLIKSALITRMAKGKKAGLDKNSAWEPLAALAYQKKCAVEPKQHAVTRVRQLFAQALGYELADTEADYGIERAGFIKEGVAEKTVLFLHGTTWDTKLWPETYWIALAELFVKAGWKIQLPWGNAEEQARAERIAAGNSAVTVLPRLSLNEVTEVLASAQAVVAVDTGLCHIAAALGVPTVSLYGPTDAKLTGAVGKNQTLLQADFVCSPCLLKRCNYQGPTVEEGSVQPPCFSSLPPVKVFEQIINN